MVFPIICFVLAAITLVCFIVEEVDYSKRLKAEMKTYQKDGFHWAGRKSHAKEDLGGSNGLAYIAIMLVFFLWGIFTLP